MKLKISFCLLMACLVLLSLPLSAQKKVRLKHADKSKGRVVNGVRVDWVIGNVVFVQDKTTIYCDSAQIFKKENTVEAYGRVRILEGDSVSATGQRLTYDGNSKVTRLRRNVVFKSGSLTLYTDFLDFDRARNEATYFNGGKVIDNDNTLTSRRGYYDMNTGLASFKTNVESRSPDYSLSSDTLQYNTKTKIIFFHASTKIIDKDGKTAVYESGYYDTNVKKSTMNKGSIETPTYKITGDLYFLDDIKKIYRATRNVVMVSKENDITIYGDEGYFDQNKGISKVYGNAYFTKLADNGDTLFLSADTLLSIENTEAKKKSLLAFNNVKIFKSDLQGTADSLVYHTADSTIDFYNAPVLWTKGNQMTADTIRIGLLGNGVDKVHLLTNSFVISQDTLRNFNQIKGRKMTAFFKGEAVHHVVVEGNGESLYFATQEEEKDLDSLILKVIFTVGMNKMICSNMRINFRDGQVNNVSAYVKPEASFIPPHEIKPKDRTLEGFKWRQDERPVKEDVVKKTDITSPFKVSKPPN